MSLKCSVFGHRFGGAELARERRERDDEVVITITETETCERCGERRVVSENKEVTTLETPSEGVDEAGETLPGSAEPAPETPAGGDTDLIEEAEEQTSADPTVGGSTGTGTADRQSAEEDDAVILGDENEGGERDTGEWPQTEDGGGEGSGWAPETDAASLDSAERDQPGGRPTDGAVTAPEGAVTAPEGAVTAPEGEFRCPECEFTAVAESSSLREGDFCPACHHGSLTCHEPE
jgi:ssDNA-binding Zn-finger/Zn-ribbon topoisomerase 1